MFQRLPELSRCLCDFLVTAHMELPRINLIFTDSLEALKNLTLLGKKCVNHTIQLECGAAHATEVCADHLIRVQ